MKKIIFEVKKKMDDSLVDEDDIFLDKYDEAIAVLYDETYEFLINVETVMHVIPEKKEATKEKLKEVEKMIDSLKKNNERIMQYICQGLIK